MPVYLFRHARFRYSIQTTTMATHLVGDLPDPHFICGRLHTQAVVTGRRDIRRRIHPRPGFYDGCLVFHVAPGGLEPPRLAARVFKTPAYTNSVHGALAGEPGFEPGERHSWNCARLFHLGHSPMVDTVSLLRLACDHLKRFTAQRSLPPSTMGAKW